MNQNDKVRRWGGCGGMCVCARVRAHREQGTLKLLNSSPTTFLEYSLALWTQSFKNDSSKSTPRNSFWEMIRQVSKDVCKVIYNSQKQTNNRGMTE